MANLNKWTFTIVEREDGTFCATGNGPLGMMVQKTGEDSDAMLLQVKKDALEQQEKTEALVQARRSENSIN